MVLFGEMESYRFSSYYQELDNTTKERLSRETWQDWTQKEIHMSIGPHKVNFCFWSVCGSISGAGPQSQFCISGQRMGVDFACGLICGLGTSTYSIFSIFLRMHVLCLCFSHFLSLSISLFSVSLSF